MSLDHILLAIEQYYKECKLRLTEKVATTVSTVGCPSGMRALLRGSAQKFISIITARKSKWNEERKECQMIPTPQENLSSLRTSTEPPCIQ